MQEFYKHELPPGKVLPYFQSTLEDANFLSNFLIREFDFSRGVFFTLLPEEIYAENLYKFKCAVGSTIISKIERIVLEVCRKDKSLSCFFDDFSSNPNTIHRVPEFQEYGVIFQGKEVYYLVSNDIATEEILADCFYFSDALWHSLCVLTEIPFKKKGGEVLTEEEMHQICEGIEYILVGAYDAEGFIFWQKTPRPSLTNILHGNFKTQETQKVGRQAEQELKKVERLYKHELPPAKVIPYFQYTLEDVNFLSNFVMKNINFSSGSFFTFLPEDIYTPSLYEFRWGIGSAIIQEVSREIVLDICKKNQLSCFFDEFGFKPKELYKNPLFQEYGMGFQNEEVYYLVNNDAVNEEILEKCFYASNMLWHSLCVLTNISFKKKGGEVLTEEEMHQICESIEYILVGAYDAEGFIFWQKNPPPSRPSS